MGVMYFLSQSVEVPAVDVDAGRVTVTKNAGGGEFDWATVTSGLTQIRSSAKKPSNAAIAIPYRNHWFYIDDSDIDSKSTFALLGQLFALQSKGDSSNSPILTLPVGG